ncbi:hypothetical protein N5P37_003528 [Trichoderma harzianum]|nr:hypothetical protein N5P37_003528 [Trichoderma harzianum]
MARDSERDRLAGRASASLIWLDRLFVYRYYGYYLYCGYYLYYGYYRYYSVQGVTIHHGSLGVESTTMDEITTIDGIAELQRQKLRRQFQEEERRLQEKGRRIREELLLAEEKVRQIQEEQRSRQGVIVHHGRPRWQFKVPEITTIDDIAERQRQLEEEGRWIQEEKRRVQEEGRQIQEEKRQLQCQIREEQRRFKEAKPKILREYLETCHSLHLSMRVVTSPFYTTTEATPTGYIFPRRIIPWDGFAAKQEEIWKDLWTGNFFHSQPQFPSERQIDYLKSRIKPVRSKFGLQNFERAAVEDAVEILFERACEDSRLQSILNLQGAVTFKDRTNVEEEAGLGAPNRPKARRKSRGKGNTVDELLVFKTSDGTQAPVAAIQYKPPHKLSIDQLVTGLSSEIRPERDIIDTDGDDFVSTSRRLATAAITQLFSYMIGKDLQYGYVCTGQAFVFLHIPDDPSVVFFSVCVPSMDVLDNGDLKFHRTAVAQVFAFLLQAIRTEPPPEAWHDEAEKLGLWEVEYDDILAKIPLTDRKRNGPLTAPYPPQCWEDFNWSSPWALSPIPNVYRTGRNISAAEIVQRRQDETTKPHIGSQPFCSQQCLLGLALGKDVDRSCPNAGCHGQKHIDRLEFLHLIREQLAVDRGRDADCMPLHRSRFRGSLFKLRLSSHGYTLVAKGMEGLDLARLQHEKEIYDRLLAIQGEYVPVCLGSIDLILPYYYDCGVYKHFLFLAWAGRPIFEYKNQINSLDLPDAVTRIFKAIHTLKVLHRDAEPRNILYDEHGGTLMVVDFQRSVFWKHQAQASVSGKDRQARKKHRELQKQHKLDMDREAEMAKQGIISRPTHQSREISEANFAAELKWVVHEVSNYVSNLKA